MEVRDKLVQSGQLAHDLIDANRKAVAVGAAFLIWVTGIQTGLDLGQYNANHQSPKATFYDPITWAAAGMADLVIDASPSHHI